jgi:FKBP-type peptidyl-prolyl cis-trans isomerase 2
MNVVKEGDTVQISCEGRLEDGTVVFKIQEETPFQLVVGKGKFFPVVENELKDMKEGESKEVSLTPKDAFGHRMEDLIVEIPNDVFETDEELTIGSRICIKTSSGNTLHGTITQLDEDSITVDFNHPLAGKKILFNVTVVSIEEPEMGDGRKKT